MPTAPECCPDGVEYLYTYRDPHLRESYDTFAGPADLAARDYTEKDLNEFIVGTVAKLDTPPQAACRRPRAGPPVFLRHHRRDAAADRKALCAWTPPCSKQQAAALSDVMANGVRVAFGSKDAVEAAKDLFDPVETL